VLLVVEDTVRADSLTVYGSARRTSPQLEQVAAAGVLFEDVTSAGSWTWPAHASLFTGRFPWEHGAHFALPTDPGSWALEPTPFSVTMPRDDLPTLAERFADAGYVTRSVSGNVLIGPDVAPMVRGFEHAVYAETDQEVVQRAQEAMAAAGDKPLFLFVNLFGAHGPHDVHQVEWVKPNTEQLTVSGAPSWLAPFLGDGVVDLHRSPAEGLPAGPPAIVAGLHPVPPDGFELLRAVYDGEVAAVDHDLHRLLEAWQTARGPEHIVAVTSDHGEYFGEHGLMEHGRSVYSQVLRVPLVLAASGRLPAGKRFSTPVQAHALHDTLLDLAGLGGGPDSLLPLVDGDVRTEAIRAAAWPDHYWAKHAGDRFAQTWRLYREGPLAAVLGEDSAELYDLGSDPGMFKDLAAERPGELQALVEAAESAFPVAPETRHTKPFEADDVLLERLRALGYSE
jgi:arylsulfatase A-like enzyme